MQSDQSAQKFHDISLDTAVYGNIFLYSLAALGAVASLWRVYELDMTRNYTLVSLLLSILVYSVTDVIIFAYYAAAGSFNHVAYTINMATCLTAHWIITQAYLGVAFDTRMLVNIKTYLDNPEKMA